MGRSTSLTSRSRARSDEMTGMATVFGFGMHPRFRRGCETRSAHPGIRLGVRPENDRNS
jgi:hypothetical protein